MTIYKGLGDYLLVETSIATLVGSRVYAGRLPQKVELLPTNAALVLSHVSEPRDLHLRGPVGVSKARWQIDAWSKSLDVANQLGRFVRWRLHGFTGEWTDGGSPSTAIRVRVIEFDNEQSVPEAEILGGLYRHSADYLITYSAEEDLVLM